jgi:hypothetical protein
LPRQLTLGIPPAHGQDRHAEHQGHENAQGKKERPSRSATQQCQRGHAGPTLPAGQNEREQADDIAEEEPGDQRADEPGKD